MQWSKTKRTVESFLCDKLIGRVEIHATNYRKAHDAPARVSVTFDGGEILSAADSAYNVRHSLLYNELSANLPLIPYSNDFWEMYNSPERQALVKVSDEVNTILSQKNIYDSYQLYEPLMLYHTLSIEDALKSEHFFAQAFAMFDRRLGKRRLQKLEITQYHPIVERFYNIRCKVEGIKNMQVT